MNKNNKPEIRFKGFTDAWEQRKFGDMYEKVTEKNDLTYGTDKIISVANMYFREEKSKSDDNYLKTYNVFKLGDIAFEGNKSKHFAHGRFVENTIGDGIVSHVFKVFSPKMKYDLQFWKYAINNEQLMGRILTRSTKASTMMTDLVDKDFLNEIFLVPSIEEQSKIGCYLEKFDNLITLHQRKLEKLQNIKKSMLEKMFPKNRNSLPEIRFKGFTDTWEQRKLGEVVDVYDGVHQTPDYTDNGIMFLSVENISTLKSEKYISEEAFNRDYKVYPEKGDILMTRIGDVGTPNVVETTEKVAFYVSLALLKTINVDSYFLCNSILSPFFQNGLKERTLVTAIPQKINKDEIGKVSLYLPDLIDEQKEIGAFFRHLDNLITLHQRKLEKLKIIKKSMLEKMFVK